MTEEPKKNSQINSKVNVHETCASTINTIWSAVRTALVHKIVLGLYMIVQIKRNDNHDIRYTPQEYTLSGPRVHVVHFIGPTYTRGLHVGNFLCRLCECATAISPINSHTHTGTTYNTCLQALLPEAHESLTDSEASNPYPAAR